MHTAVVCRRCRGTTRGGETQSNKKGTKNTELPRLCPCTEGTGDEGWGQKTRQRRMGREAGGAPASPGLGLALTHHLQ